MKYSLTQGGILFAIIGTLLMKYGFSEVCSDEIVTNLPMFIGGVVAWWGRVRAGGVNMLGVKIGDNPY